MYTYETSMWLSVSCKSYHQYNQYLFFVYYQITISVALFL
jgi:hypothetical protein